jgi:hypothetical protein
LASIRPVDRIVNPAGQSPKHQAQCGLSLGIRRKIYWSGGSKSRECCADDHLARAARNVPLSQEHDGARHDRSVATVRRCSLRRLSGQSETGVPESRTYRPEPGLRSAGASLAIARSIRRRIVTPDTISECDARSTRRMNWACNSRQSMFLGTGYISRFSANLHHHRLVATIRHDGPTMQKVVIMPLHVSRSARPQ